MGSSKTSLVQLASGTTLPAEYSAAEFENEVLRTGGQPEALFDEALHQEAQALGFSIPQTPTLAHHSICASATTTDSIHVWTGSTISKQSESTTLTSTSSNDQLEGLEPTHMSKPTSYRRSVSFSEYEQYADGMDAPPKAAEPSLFSVNSRRQYNVIRNGLKSRFRLRRTKAPSSSNSTPCIRCRTEFGTIQALHTLACQHKYCEICLRVLVSQASVDEAKMPPQCCSNAIPSTIIRGLLDKEEQIKFVTAFLQFSTPREARIFCPEITCGKFIPKGAKIDPKHPFEVLCQRCQTRACSNCKYAAHAVGQDCPADCEFDTVSQKEEKSSWRRCYNCRNIVELTHGCRHMTCRCNAQFCYICGAVWDPVVGCPNCHNGVEELDRQRQQEEAQIAISEAEKLAREEVDKLEASKKLAAKKCTQESPQLNALREQQIDERDRFCTFERKMKWIMWNRQASAKLQILDEHGELQTKMKQRHISITNQLEDRQVCAEMELRSHFIKRTRIVKACLAHMEAYCDGLGRSANGSKPARTVTERDLRELGQQYNIRDDLERLHQSKINVMRDKQAKQMEKILLGQQEELAFLAAKQTADLEILEESFRNEEEGFFTLFDDRKERMCSRWRLTEEITRKKLEIKDGVGFAPLMTIDWPDLKRKDDGELNDMAE